MHGEKSLNDLTLYLALLVIDMGARPCKRRRSVYIVRSAYIFFFDFVFVGSTSIFLIIQS